jgi:hypothetical protein
MAIVWFRHLHLNVTIGFGLRHPSASSPQHPAESSSSSYGPIIRLRLLPTPPRGDAVTLGYRALAYSDTDLHRADNAPLRVYGPPTSVGARRRRFPFGGFCRVHGMSRRLKSAVPGCAGRDRDRIRIGPRRVPSTKRKWKITGSKCSRTLRRTGGRYFRLPPSCLRRFPADWGQDGLRFDSREWERTGRHTPAYVPSSRRSLSFDKESEHAPSGRGWSASSPAWRRDLAFWWWVYGLPLGLKVGD